LLSKRFLQISKHNLTSKHEASAKRRKSRLLWYLLPIFLQIIGGLIVYFSLRNSNSTIAKNALGVGIILSLVTAVIVIYLYQSYQADMAAAQDRIAAGGSQLINTAYGPLEYADVGNGYPVLAIHGTGGGFDQGLLAADLFLGEEVTDSHRIIAPSRFGYLKTPMPSGDASPAAQADAHAALLDALGIDQKVVVIGASAGAFSATDFAIKYPDRVSTLVLAVPDSWSPESAASGAAQIGSNDFIRNSVLKSDFIMWVFMKVAGNQMLSYVGAPEELQKTMTPQEKADARQLIEMILPVSQRSIGIMNDEANHQNRHRLALEEIRAPTIIIDAKDIETFCWFEIYRGAYPEREVCSV
jgi:2-hydroxy-6-oxonona-2,4-dienedioate hydrolase